MTTGVSTPIVKHKPNDSITCEVTATVIDDVTNEVTRKIVTHNLRKEAFADFIATLNYAHYSFFNTGISRKEALNEMIMMYALYDENVVESGLFNPFEGEVVGYIDATNNAVSAKDNQGQRNDLTTGVFYDPVKKALVCRLEGVFDATKMVGKKINKILIGTKTNGADPDLTGSGYRLLNKAHEMEMRFKDTSFMPKLAATEHLSMAHGSLLTHALAVGEEMVLKGISLHQPTVHGYFSMDDTFTINLGDVDSVVSYNRNVTYRIVRETDHLKLHWFALTANNEVTHRVYKLDGLPETYAGTVVQASMLEETKYSHDGDVDITKPLGCVATGTGWNLVLTLANAAGLVHLDTTAKTATVTNTELPFHPKHAVKVNDDVYLITVANSHYDALTTANKKIIGGYFDIKNKRFIECMNGGVAANAGITGHFFCVDTGNIYDFSKKEVTIWIPTEYVPPFKLLHVVTSNTIEKQRGERVVIGYDIEIPNTLATITDPFSKVTGLEPDSLLVVKPKESSTEPDLYGKGLLAPAGDKAQYPKLVNMEGDNPVFINTVAFTMERDVDNSTAKLVATYAGSDGVEKVTKWSFDYWSSDNPPAMSTVVNTFKTKRGANKTTSNQPFDYIKNADKVINITGTERSFGSVEMRFADTVKSTEHNPVGLNSLITIPLVLDGEYMERTDVLPEDYDGYVQVKTNSNSSYHVYVYIVSHPEKQGQHRFRVVDTLNKTDDVYIDLPADFDINTKVIANKVSGNGGGWSTRIPTPKSMASLVDTSNYVFGGYMNYNGRVNKGGIYMPQEGNNNPIVDVGGDPILLLEIDIDTRG